MENLLLNNHSLSYDMTNSKLDDFAIKMIQKNRNLDCIVPINIKGNNINFDIKEYSNLTTVMENPLDATSVLSLFIQICEIINYTKIHMLYKNNLIFDPDYVFIDTQTFSLKMIYIPIHNMDNQINLRNFFKELLFDIDTDDLQFSTSIFKKINKKPFNFTELFDFLKNKQLELSQENENTDNKNQDISTNEPIKSTPVIPIEPITITDEHVTENIEFESNSKVENILPSYNDTEFSVEPIIPDNTELSENIIEDSTPILPLEDKSTNNNDYTVKLNVADIVDNTDNKSINFDDIEDNEDMRDIQQFLKANDEEDNSFMDKLFTPNINDIPNENSVAKITRTKDNSTMIINKKYFIIGSYKNTDFTITDNPKISRSHATIITENDGYYISDNGSSNGTWVNGIRIKQLEKLKLSHKDIITLATDEKLIFYLE